mmetsp:Transcript_9618/g.13325  ORF Transcript_9618/g.13325 Transcript_9618/m.13325 type:complete len:123 (+) Transcript_9618:19-387(+)
MLIAARTFMKKWGVVGIVTYVGVDLTAFSVCYALIATRTIDPMPSLKFLVRSAKETAGLDLSFLIAKLIDVESQPASNFGANILMTLACTKILTPLKFPLAAILAPRVLYFYKYVWRGKITS